MRYIDKENWPRKQHYEFFIGFDSPQFNVCSNIDVTKTCMYAKDNELSLFKVILFCVMKAVNDIEDFKYRIRDNEVIVHDTVHAGFTAMTENELYSNTLAEYHTDSKVFFKRVQASIDTVKEKPTLYIPNHERDDVIYISCLPWVSFTSVSHPVKLSRTDSVPRITWGKIFEEGQLMKLPISVQVHHSLMDGVHVSKYLAYLQNLFNTPEEFFKKQADICQG